MPGHSDFLHYFQRCATDIRACIGAAVRDAHRREDIFQEVSRVLWRKFDEFDPAGSFGGWARGIALNKVLEAKRNDDRFPLALPPEVLVAMLETFRDVPPLARDEEEALEHCLAKLPANSRRLLRWRYEEGESCTELARRTKVNPKAMHQTLCRLRRALAGCIRQRLAEPDPVPTTCHD